MLRVIACAVLASIAPAAVAQGAAPAALWYTAGHVALTVIDAARGLTATWQFDRADNDDVRVVKDEQRGAARVSGTLLSVCGDQALLFRDIVPERRSELREFDEPVLHLQLALRLLARALPQGPLAMAAEMSVETGEEQIDLLVRKGQRARLQFAAPWRVRGTVNRAGDESVRFDLEFAYGGGPHAQAAAALKLAGVWQQQSALRALDDAFALAGWRVHRVDTVADAMAGVTVLDNVVQPQPLQFATLGELRQRIEQRWDSGPRAVRHFECVR